MHLTPGVSLRIAMTLLAAGFLRAQPAALPTGHWEGAIDVSGREIGIELDLTKDSQGSLAGAFSSPGQNLKGLALGNFAWQGATLRFQIKGKPGDRMFHGKLAADGLSMAGEYSQGGYTMAFQVKRTGDARAEAQEASAAVGPEFEGVWRGTMDVEDKSLRIVLTMVNRPDGTATATMLSIDEGLEVPVHVVQKESNLLIDVKAVGGSYSGILNKERTELAGDYRIGTLQVPLTLRRASAADNQGK